MASNNDHSQQNGRNPLAIASLLNDDDRAGQGEAVARLNRESQIGTGGRVRAGVVVTSEIVATKFIISRLGRTDLLDREDESRAEAKRKEEKRKSRDDAKQEKERREREKEECKPETKKRQRRKLETDEERREAWRLRKQKSRARKAALKSQE